ncbi:hypothetical protein IB277_19470 [Ensifer sp. ENS07]|uniref:hypothetical protein n=1 Tax=Ensifer sp. ENS07 TaxID=2769274 RepID=UPI001784C417|nr:hypothetical protein [Ensifer sp. ENS07]MBD9638485.1 hypothetical protein [Ensifer sp. ENS07]
MSGCYVNPVVGEPQSLDDIIDYRVYRPGDVRLYGKPAASNITSCDISIEEKIKEIQDMGVADDIIKAIMHIIECILKTAELITEGATIVVHDGTYYSFLPIGFGDLHMKSIGVIYGYSYEGHCYKLPKPQIMCLPENPSQIAEGDCGCDCGFDPKFGYAVWSIDKLERAISLDIRADDLKALVLDENLPGNRSPLAYAQTMALAPQRQRE